MADGFHDVLGLEPQDSADGWSRVVLRAGERHLNGHGTVHGGAVATLCDAAMGMAVVAAGAESPVTIEMKVTYLRPADQGELVAVVREQAADSGRGGNSLAQQRGGRSSLFVAHGHGHRE